MRRTLALAYGVASSLVFLATGGFVGDEHRAKRPPDATSSRSQLAEFWQ